MCALLLSVLRRVIIRELRTRPCSLGDVSVAYLHHIWGRHSSDGCDQACLCARQHPAQILPSSATLCSANRLMIMATTHALYRYAISADFEKITLAYLLALPGRPGHMFQGTHKPYIHALSCFHTQACVPVIFCTFSSRFCAYIYMVQVHALAMHAVASAHSKA